MKKHMLLSCTMIIIFITVVSFVCMVYRNTKAYQELAEKHLENVLSLAGADILKHIENSMTKPVMVSKTMANDEFLKNWLKDEPNNSHRQAYLQQLYDYLKAYQLKYGYTTVFCVSEQTGNYYYQDGLNKVISKTDKHDVWYYNFIESGNEYDLQVDTNEVSGNSVTVFVNFRMENDDGSLLGAIGVGLQLGLIEEMIRLYETDYDISVYIINVGGSENSFNRSTDIFIGYDELAERTGISDEIDMTRYSEPKMQWFTSGGERKCLIIKYDDSLGWYLILEKDTGSISSVFQARIKDGVIFMLISLAVCIVVITAVFNIYNRRIITMENTDELTGLLNRKMFNKLYMDFLRRHREQKKTVFMMDIDSFKSINDTYGHLFGNAVLAMVGEKLRDAIKNRGMAARWGGDEFLGVLPLDVAEAEKIMRGFMDSLNGDEKAAPYRVTVSLGLAEFGGKLGVEQIIKMADEALYLSKENGRNKITVYGGKYSV